MKNNVIMLPTRLIWNGIPAAVAFSRRPASSDFATAALDNGLVDGLLTHAQVRDLLIDIVGADEERPDTYSAAGMHEYLAQMRMLAGGMVGEENVDRVRTIVEERGAKTHVIGRATEDPDKVVRLTQIGLAGSGTTFASA